MKGGYWLLDQSGEPDFDPGKNVAHIFASGALMEEALRASQMLLQRHRIFAKVCNVTSWERLKRDHDAYWSNPELQNDEGASYHLHDLIADNKCDVPSVIVGDFAPEVAEWVSGALNRRIPVLAPKHFSVAGALNEVRRFHGIDAESIAHAIQNEFNQPWKPLIKRS